MFQKYHNILIRQYRPALNYRLLHFVVKIKRCKGQLYKQNVLGFCRICDQWYSNLNWANCCHNIKLTIFHELWYTPTGIFFLNENTWLKLSWNPSTPLCVAFKTRTNQKWKVIHIGKEDIVQKWADLTPNMESGSEQSNTCLQSTTDNYLPHATSQTFWLQLVERTIVLR